MKLNRHIILMVAAHKWRELREARVFRVLIVALVSLLALSLIAGWREGVRIRAQQREAEQNQRRQWVERRVDSAHVAAHAGTTVFRPFPAAGIIDSGIHPFTGVALFLEAHRRNDLSGAPMERQDGLLRTCLLSLATVLQVVAPLFIAVLLAPAFSAEKENGTLRLMLAMGVDGRALAAGKALGITAPVVGVALLALPASWLAIALAWGGAEAAANTLPSCS